MNHNMNTAGAQVPQTRMESALHTNSGAIESLEITVSQLEQRLASVLRPYVPPPPASAGGGKLAAVTEEASPAVSVLDAHHSRLCALRAAWAT